MLFPTKEIVCVDIDERVKLEKFLSFQEYTTLNSKIVFMCTPQQSIHDHCLRIQHSSWFGATTRNIFERKTKTELSVNVISRSCINHILPELLNIHIDCQLNYLLIAAHNADIVSVGRNKKTTFYIKIPSVK